jgi:hypothetical protein
MRNLSACAAARKRVRAVCLSCRNMGCLGRCHFALETVAVGHEETAGNPRAIRKSVQPAPATSTPFRQLHS